MEEQELNLLENLAPNHPELQELWDQHTLLKKQTEKMDSKPFLNSEEELPSGAIFFTKYPNES